MCLIPLAIEVTFAPAQASLKYSGIGSLFARFQRVKGKKCAFATGQLAGEGMTGGCSDQSQMLLRLTLLQLIMYLL